MPSLQPMELLAPAGGFPAFEAALEAGADAIYVGAPGFNARALSRDFTLAEIGSLIAQAHQAGRRVYLSMNRWLSSRLVSIRAFPTQPMAAYRKQPAYTPDTGTYRPGW